MQLLYQPPLVIVAVGGRLQAAQQNSSGTIINNSSVRLASLLAPNAGHSKAAADTVTSYSGQPASAGVVQQVLAPPPSIPAAVEVAHLLGFVLQAPITLVSHPLFPQVTVGLP